MTMSAQQYLEQLEINSDKKLKLVSFLLRSEPEVTCENFQNLHLPITKEATNIKAKMIINIAEKTKFFDKGLLFADMAMLAQHKFIEKGFGDAKDFQKTVTSHLFVRSNSHDINVKKLRA